MGAKRKDMDNSKQVMSVEIDDLRDSGSTIYSDKDIVLINGIREIEQRDALLVNLIALVYCSRGKAQMKINGKQHAIVKDDIAICVPKTLVEDIMVSTDFDSVILGLSATAVRHTLQTNNLMWNYRLFLQQTPVIHANQSAYLGSLYHDIIAEKVHNPSHMFQREIMHSLFQCLFYELMAVLRPLMGDKPLDGTVKQGNLLCRRFLEMVAQNEGRERSVSSYAKQLCVTPKYLSTTVKAATGKTALEWIHNITTESIVRQLKFSDRSIKEISEDMCFPNLSFFGKFVKSRVGMSPSEYRKQMHKD